MHKQPHFQEGSAIAGKTLFFSSILLSTLFFIFQNAVGNGIATGNDLVKKLEKAAALKQQFKYKRALKIYHKVYKRDSGNYEALINLSYLYSMLGDNIRNDNKQRYFYRSGLQFAQEAVHCFPEDAAANYAMAFALEKPMNILGLKSKLETGVRVKYYAEKTLSLNPRHGKAWFILGMWYYDMSRLKKENIPLARIMLQGQWEEATLENAGLVFRTALKLEQESIPVHYYCALVMSALEQDQKAITVLKKAVCIHPETKMEKEYLRKCSILLEIHLNDH